MKKYALMICVLGSANVLAQDWSASLGLQMSDSLSTLPGSKSQSRSDNLSATLTRRIDSKNQVGGSVGYGTGKTTNDVSQGDFGNNATSLALFWVRELEPLRFLDLSAAYGRTVLNGSYMSAGSPIRFDTTANFYTLGAGLTQVLPLGNNLVATLNARANYSTSSTSDYADSAGTRHPSVDTSRTVASVGGALNWRFGQWSPSMGVNYLRSDKNFSGGVDDKDYFTLNLGLGYAVSPKTTLRLGYTGVADKASVEEKSLSLSISSSF